MGRLGVLYITSWYPTKQKPVEGIFVREHAKAVRLYDDVVVLHCTGPDPDLAGIWRMERETDERLTEGIPTYRIWHRGSVIPFLSYFCYLWSVLMAFRRTVTQGFQPDIIHAHVYQAGVPAILLGRLNLIPVVVTEHSSIFPRMMLSSKGVILARFAFQCADAVLPVSNVLKKGIERYGIRADFRVVPNAVDTGLFCPPDGRFEMGKKKLLLVGLLDRSHKKGVPYLLQALAELRRTRNDFQLDIVGDGPARRDYEKMARQLNLSTHVVFHGLKRKREVARFMREADILVLPSLIETFGLVAAEAMACGTPVLATKCGGPEEFLLEGMGTLVPPANAEALREALHDMLIRIDDFDRHGIAQYARERFSRERVGSVLHAIYVSAIHKHRHAA